MSADRMERIRAKAREVERTTDELYGSGGAYAAGAFVAGAHRFRTLSDTEWKAMRETVAQAIYRIENDKYGDYCTPDDAADAAMTAMGFRRGPPSPNPYRTERTTDE